MGPVTETLSNLIVPRRHRIQSDTVHGVRRHGKVTILHREVGRFDEQYGPDNPTSSAGDVVEVVAISSKSGSSLHVMSPFNLFGTKIGTNWYQNSNPTLATSKKDRHEPKRPRPKRLTRRPFDSSCSLQLQLSTSCRQLTVNGKRSHGV